MRWRWVGGLLVVLRLLLVGSRSLLGLSEGLVDVRYKFKVGGGGKVVESRDRASLIW